MKARYLFPSDYMADPAAHVFNGRVYVYPSHDWEGHPIQAQTHRVCVTPIHASGGDIDALHVDP